MSAAGEQLHERGREGAKRAKTWLEATTRVDVNWINPDGVQKLTFHWETGNTFSFDLGGLLRGGDYHRQEFFAEIKNYSDAHDQGTLYTEYLAKCYRALKLMPARCDHFMWLTWHPFSVKKWADLCSAKEVQRAVIENRERCLGIEKQAEAEVAVDARLCEEVASRLWLIVLSEKQETLVIDEVDRQHVVLKQMERGYGAA